jgi:hypothetical protein
MRSEATRGLKRNSHPFFPSLKYTEHQESVASLSLQARQIN